MLKKLLVASACTMAFATGAFAEKITKAPVDLEIYGDLEAVYKIQNDYNTPLDSWDYFDEKMGAALEATGADNPGYDYRDGANNRSQQTTRAKGALTMVARSGENDYNGKPWYNLIGVMKLTMDANDPDYEDNENRDGAQSDNVGVGDVWIRYSPVVMLGVKIGSQTIAATANAYGIGHTFPGDIDGDFIFYTCAVLDEKPGISIDLHLGEGIELGIGMLQGLGDFSAIVSGGKSQEANNTVIWFDGKFGFLDFTFANQTIAVGGADDDDEILNQAQHEFTHNLMNFVIKVNIGGFSPFIGYQAASGENTGPFSYAADFVAYNADYVEPSSLDVEEITEPYADQSISLEMMTFGLLAEIGPGKLAFEYTTASSPDYGEENYVLAAVELGGTTHLNYTFPITENADLVLFYSSFNAKESTNLRDDISTLENNSERFTANGDAVAALLSDNYALLLGAFKASTSASVGMSFNMKFGN